MTATNVAVRLALYGFCKKAGYPFQDKISPETLTTLTLLIAESNPSDKEKMIGIIKLLLNPNFKESKTKN